MTTTKDHKLKKLPSQLKDKKDKPNQVDIYVGSRLRMRRTLLGISQGKLADIIDLTFQQVQKYESGKNRISASRLYQFSKILGVPISYFFENFGSADTQSKFQLSDNEQEPFSDDDIFKKKETIELIRSYYSVADPKLRKDLLKMIRTMAKNLS